MQHELYIELYNHDCSRLIIELSGR